MAQIDEILDFNRRFVESKEYEKYATSKYPDKRIAIVPEDVKVGGYVMDSVTGELKTIEE